MMDKLFVNGEKKLIEFDENDKFSNLIQKIYEEFSSKTHSLSSLKINGIEISPETEEMLGAEPVKHIDKIEVEVIPTNDVAHKTLMNVKESLVSMIDLCGKLAKEDDVKAFNYGFIELVEGLQTTFEAVELVKRYWKLESDPEVLALEERLESAISQVLLYRQSDQKSKVKEVLSSALPESLQLWWDVAIPTMIQSRTKNSS